MTKGINAAYDKDAELETEGSLQSARIIVPILLKLVNVKSVIDVGCARGAWLKALQENGVQEILGLDGPWISKSKLLIPKTSFCEVDFGQSLEIPGKFDLAVCVEVAEHLPASAAEPLIRRLTAAAPLVLFSAAIPGQTGTYHVNEQLPVYWKSLFAQQGFRRLDCIRPHVWQDKRVDWWYRQNIFLYASREAVAKSAALEAQERRTGNSEMECIHEDILARYEQIRLQSMNLTGSRGEVFGGLLHAIKRSLWWLIGKAKHEAS